MDENGLSRVNRCNRLRCPGLDCLSVQCYYKGHNGHGINLYGVIMTLMGNSHTGGQSNLGHLSVLHRDQLVMLLLPGCPGSIPRIFHHVIRIYHTIMENTKWDCVLEPFGILSGKGFLYFIFIIWTKLATFCNSMPWYFIIITLITTKVLLWNNLISKITNHTSQPTVPWLHI